MVDAHEQEQIDAIKQWWQRNGTFILICLLLFVAATGGWTGWQNYQQKQSMEAVTLYESFMQQIESGDAERVNAAVKKLKTSYADTPYASYALLFAAQVNHQSDDLVRARQQLQWVIDHAPEPALKDVARLRQAALLLDQQKFDEGLALLKEPHLDSFNGLFADLKGDLLAAKGEQQAALKAYQVAYDNIEDQRMYRHFIQMKIDDLEVVQ